MPMTLLVQAELVEYSVQLEERMQLEEVRRSELEGQVVLEVAVEQLEQQQGHARVEVLYYHSHHPNLLHPMKPSV